MREKMYLRKRYVFDRSEEPTDCKYIQFLAASADERTWWVKGGARCGVRLLAHFTDDDKVYTALHLHATVLVESADPGNVRRLLQEAANQKDPDRLEPPSVLPGFTPRDAERDSLHAQGWYTKTERVLRLAPPWWAPDAQAFDIREGIYVYFPDETSRLCRRREYYNLTSCTHPIVQRVLIRQGDLLFIEKGGYERRVFEQWNGSRMQTRTLGDTEIVDLDRHHIDVGGEVVSHPEHGTMDLPSGPWVAMLAPGTSHPFNGNGRSD
jgi:hypothetical protein